MRETNQVALGMETGRCSPVFVFRSNELGRRTEILHRQIESNAELAIFSNRFVCYTGH